jgi:photosystem II stability/assembly factor-like uncharacterized protein
VFEHLDDPSPPEATRSTLAEVLARSARMRRKRTRAALGAVGALGLAAGLVLGLSVPASSPGQSFTAFETSSGTLATGTAVPGSDLQDVVFPSDTQGFALVVHASQTLLAHTTDAGETWTVVDGALPVSYPAQIDFSDATHGFLWGGHPSSDGSLPLWVSSDGGANWTEAPIGPVVSDVSAIRYDVWAVVGTCFLGVVDPASSCPVRVEVSSDYGRTWATTASDPAVVESTAPSFSDQNLELARTSHLDAYVLSLEPGRSGSQPSGQLAFTADGGRSWQSRSDPCPPYFDFGEQIAASGTDDLWLLCASQAAAGSQAKALYRSHDGAHNWTLTSAANAPVLTGNTTVPAGGGLPTGGYLAPYTLAHENFAVLSSKTALILPGRGAVSMTSDGGSSWQAVPSLLNAGMVGGGNGTVVFADPTHGWVSEFGVGLWRTTDGLSWHRLGR